MAEERAPIIALEGIVRRFPSGEGGTLTVLGGIDLSIQPGESLAITGPSGCGKSTLLNIIGALDRPSEGAVRFENQLISELDDEALAAHRNKKIGFVFQAHHLLPQCTALLNVLLPTLTRSGAAGPETVARARELLTRVGLSERIEHKPGQLSGGERQRVAVVRALINRPRLLLADEPTGALDAQSSDELAELLLSLNKEDGLTLVVVTHAPDLAARLGRSLKLEAGVLAAAGAGT